MIFYMVLGQENNFSVLEDRQSDPAVSLLFSQLPSGSSVRLPLCATYPGPSPSRRRWAGPTLCMMVFFLSWGDQNGMQDSTC